MLTLTVACVCNESNVLQSPTTPHLLVMFFIGPKSKYSASAVETSHLKMADSSHTEAFSLCSLALFAFCFPCDDCAQAAKSPEAHFRCLGYRRLKATWMKNVCVLRSSRLKPGEGAWICKV